VVVIDQAPPARALSGFPTVPARRRRHQHRAPAHRTRSCSRYSGKIVAPWRLTGLRTCYSFAGCREGTRWDCGSCNGRTGRVGVQRLGRAGTPRPRPRGVLGATPDMRAGTSARSAARTARHHRATSRHRRSLALDATAVIIHRSGQTRRGWVDCTACGPGEKVGDAGRVAVPETSEVPRRCVKGPWRARATLQAQACAGWHQREVPRCCSPRYLRGVTSFAAEEFFRPANLRGTRCCCVVHGFRRIPEKAGLTGPPAEKMEQRGFNPGRKDGRRKMGFKAEPRCGLPGVAVGVRDDPIHRWASSTRPRSRPEVPWEDLSGAEVVVRRHRYELADGEENSTPHGHSDPQASGIV